MSDLGGDVEGVTDFFRGKKPRVRIAANLWEGTSRKNRLRTTLAHEFRHVHFHNYLYQVEAGPELFSGLAKGAPLRCKRESILGAPKPDWMEWQAGYVCGSLLMPISHLRRLTSALFQSQVPPVVVTSAGGHHVIDAVATAFQVSREAARVRLLQLRYLTENELQLLLNLQ